jgi:hypothetical protein
MFDVSDGYRFVSRYFLTLNCNGQVVKVFERQIQRYQNVSFRSVLLVQATPERSLLAVLRAIPRRTEPWRERGSVEKLS